MHGCPNLAHHKLSRSMKDIPSPETIRSDSASRLQDILDNGKTSPARPPDVPTNPDRSCTYLVLKATPDEHYVQLKPTLKFPRGGATSGSVLDQHSEEHWPGGFNKYDPRAPETQGKKRLGGDKTNVGHCWRSFIQGELSRGSHYNLTV